KSAAKMSVRLAIPVLPPRFAKEDGIVMRHRARRGRRRAVTAGAAAVGKGGETFLFLPFSGGTAPTRRGAKPAPCNIVQQFSRRVAQCCRSRGRFLFLPFYGGSWGCSTGAGAGRSGVSDEQAA